MLGPSQVATSSRTRVVPSETSERSPPMTPAIAVGPSLSQTRTIPSSSARSSSSSVRSVSPCLAVRTIRAPSGDEVEVEGVQRLAGQQHRVVGDVDDVVDRLAAGGLQALDEPVGRGADGDVGEDARREARAEVGDLDRDRGEVLNLAFAGRLGVRPPRLLVERRAADRVDLAGDAVDAEAVGPVRRHLELEHGGVAVAEDPLDLGPGHRQPLGESLGRQPGVTVLLQPLERNAHQNCSRNRTSLSKKSRRSGTPCLSIAIRSTPCRRRSPGPSRGRSRSP